MTRGIDRRRNLRCDYFQKKRWFSRYCKETRNALYFTFLDYAPKFCRTIYTTNWIERLNRCYKRTLSMRGAMPSVSSVLFLLDSVAMEMTKTTYSYPVSLFMDWTSTSKNRDK